MQAIARFTRQPNREGKTDYFEFTNRYLDDAPEKLAQTTLARLYEAYMKNLIEPRNFPPLEEVLKSPEFRGRVNPKFKFTDELFEAERSGVSNVALLSCWDGGLCARHALCFMRRYRELVEKKPDACPWYKRVSECTCL